MVSKQLKLTFPMTNWAKCEAAAAIVVVVVVVAVVIMRVVVQVSPFMRVNV